MFSPNFAVLLLFCLRTYRVFGQELSETSGWALRANQTCPTTESDCGPTANGFFGCCPASSPCLIQYNNVCCPPSKPCPSPQDSSQLKYCFRFSRHVLTPISHEIVSDTNCTDALVASGPWCADPTWVLCDNNGYFCCLPGLTCYNDSNIDGCAYPGYQVRANQQVLPALHQVPRSVASTTTTTSSAASSATSNTTSLYSAQQPSTASSTPSQGSSGDLSTSDKIAIGIRVPVGSATSLGVWVTWRLHRRKMRKE